jgi:lipid-A-disaccharide synthase
MFVAGDPSGDEHAAAVIGRMSGCMPGATTFGIGGPKMAAAGFEQLMPFEPFNRMGLWEVVRHLPFFLNAKSYLVKELKRRKPSALVCVDYPGFNIPLMKAAHAAGIPVVWYIVPQVWAWKKKRAETLGRFASFIGVVFPFEVPYFRPYGAQVSFVGHPLVEALDESHYFSPVHQRAAALDKNGPIRCAIVPGSRVQEIRLMLGPMMNACDILLGKYPRLSVTVSKCRGLPHEPFAFHCDSLYALHAGRLAVSEDPLADILAASDCAVVTSGTATLQTALFKVPLVIAYRTSGLTYSILKRMVTLPFIGLPNIVAGEKIVPELIQGQATPQAIAEAVSRFIDFPALYAGTVESLGALREKLGGKKPSVEMANAIRSVVMTSGGA